MTFTELIAMFADDHALVTEPDDATIMDMIERYLALADQLDMKINFAKCAYMGEQLQYLDTLGIPVIQVPWHHTVRIW